MGRCREILIHTIELPERINAALLITAAGAMFVGLGRQLEKNQIVLPGESYPGWNYPRFTPRRKETTR